MGCCCEAHLLTKINEYIEHARDGEVTVRKFTAQPTTGIITCDYCKAKAAYTVSYFSK